MKTKDWTESKVEIYDRGYAAGYQDAANRYDPILRALSELWWAGESLDANRVARARNEARSALDAFAAKHDGEADVIPFGQERES